MNYYLYSRVIDSRTEYSISASENKEGYSLITSINVSEEDDPFTSAAVYIDTVIKQEGDYSLYRG